MCEVYPEHRVKLDDYLAFIWDLALHYGGSLFYKYHKSLTAKAALYLQKWNVRLDWSVRDLDLVSRLFTGHMPLSCLVRRCLGHSVNLCLTTAYVADVKFEAPQRQYQKVVGGK